VAHRGTLPFLEPIRLSSARGFQAQLVARPIKRNTARGINRNTIMTRMEGGAPTRDASIIVLPDWSMDRWPDENAVSIDHWTAGRNE
jgi:hypothetical protein